MSDSQLVSDLNRAKEYFDRSSRCFTEEDSTFRPTAESMSVAQQIAHVAQTIDWFVEGAFRPEGFDMDFETSALKIMKVESLAEARAWSDRAFANAVSVLGSKSEEEMMVALPEGPVMGGEPRIAIIHGIQDHTAHHRGALTVLARLRGHQPTMPYSDDM